MPCVMNWVQIACPKCGVPQNFYACRTADVKEDPTLKEKLFRGELNVGDCVQCKARFHFDEYMLYSDRDRGLLVNVFPADAATRRAELSGRLYRELSSLSPTEAAPSFLVFGYATLARILGLVDRELSERKPAEIQAMSPEDHFRLFILVEEWLNAHADPGFKERLPEAEAAMKGAVGLHERGDLPGAVAAYEKILTGLPNFFPAAFNLGLLQFSELGNPEKALACFETCFALRPNDSEVAFGLGQILLKLRQVDQAIEYFRLSVLTDPRKCLPWFNLGMGLVLQGNKNEGIEVLERSLELATNPEDRKLVLRTLQGVQEKL